MGSSGDVDLLRFVADEGDVQFGIFGSVEREVSRGIGRRTDRSAFDQNRCAYDWRPGRIGHRARHLLVLCRDVSLKEDSHTIDDVVVTAMGITRSEKTLGYSVSTVKSDELTKARDGNILNALSGKVAGVNISSSSGTAGGSSRIIIRGQSSLGSSGQPLFVIDGMPVSNQSYDPGNAGSALSGAAVDPGNRMGDIASDDIESINVLKGAAATALVVGTPCAYEFWKSGRRSTLSKRIVELIETLVCWFFEPFFVVMITAPSLARAP